MENRVLYHLGITLPLAIATIVGFTDNNPIFAQLTPDNTLGTESSVVIQQQLQNLIQGGAIRGNALFHSFSEFNVEDGGSVFFDLQNNGNILNILTRVTGGNPSNILGTLGVLNDLGNANLFLLNPNGITFGENANLQLSGSFFATTADGIGFDNFTFSASGQEAPPPLLTVNIPRFLSFRDNPGDITVNQQGNLTVNRGDIDVEGGNLSVSQGQNLSLVGRNVTVNGGQLNAEGGRIEIAGMYVGGNVTLNEDGSLASFPDEVIPSGATTLPQERLPETGTVTINTNILNLSNGAEVVSQTQDSPVGGVIVNATESVNITNGGRIFSILANGTGNSQGITINSPNVLVDGQLANNRRSSIAVGGRDRDTSSLIPTNAGNLAIDTDTLTVTNNAQILTISLDLFQDNNDFGDSNANVGNITINARESVNITNGGFILAQAQAQSNPELPPEVTGGNVGGIFIDSPLVTLEGGETGNGSILLQVAQSTSSNAENLNFQGSVGRLEINTRTLSLDGIDSNGFGQISAQIWGAGNIGDNVDGILTSIIINAEERVTFDGNSLIFVQTRRSGNVGDIIINTPDFSLNESSLIFSRTGLDATSQQDNGLATGNAGDIRFNVSTLTLSDRNNPFQEGSKIQSQTFGVGEAGDIIINASESVSVSSDFEDSPSLIISNLVSSFGSQSETGNVRSSGDITIETTSLSLDNGQITASTGGNGNAGNINITASDSLLLENGSFITASTTTNGDAGNIKINVSDTITIDGEGSGIFANTSVNSTGNGGSINIDPQLVLLRNGARIAVNAQGSGVGGNISIDTDLLVAFPDENSDITANAQGQAGRIEINAQGVFGLEVREGNVTQEDPNQSEITAFSQQDPSLDGQITFNTPETNPGSETIEQPEEVVDSSDIVSQNVCSDFGGNSQLNNTGRGGVSQIPGFTIRNDVVDVELVDEVLPAPPPEAIKPHHRTTVTILNSEGEEIKPAMGAVLLPNGMVEFVDYSPAEVYRDMYQDMYAAGCLIDNSPS